MFEQVDRLCGKVAEAPADLIVSKERSVSDYRLEAGRTPDLSRSIAHVIECKCKAPQPQHSSGTFHNRGFGLIVVANFLFSFTLSILKYLNLDTDTESFLTDDADISYISRIGCIALFITVVVSSCWSIAWTLLAQYSLEIIINSSFVVPYCASVLAIIFACSYSVASIYVTLTINFLLSVYYYTHRREIRFCSAFLSVSVKCLKAYPQMLFISSAGMLLEVSVFLAYLYAILSSLDTKAYVFLCYLLLSMCWSLSVIRFSVHVVCSAVCGAYFLESDRCSPASRDLVRIMMTSFDSISYVSFVFTCFAVPIRCFRYFAHCNALYAAVSLVNQYSLSYMALFGSDLAQSMENTEQLLERNGIGKLIPETYCNPTSFGITTGSIVSFLLSLGISLRLTQFDDVPKTSTMSLILFGGIMFSAILFLSRQIIGMVMQPLDSGVSTFLLCWSADPSALKSSRPAEYLAMAEICNEALPQSNAATDLA